MLQVLERKAVVVGWGLGLFLLLMAGCSDRGQSGNTTATLSDRAGLTDDPCRLLDDPQARAMMSGAFETKLRQACSVGAKQPSTVTPAPGAHSESEPQGLALVSGADQLLNDPSLDSGGTTQSETTVVEANGVVCVAWNDAGEGFGANGFSGFGYSSDGTSFIDQGPQPSGPNGEVSRGDPSLAYSVRDDAFYYAALSTVGLSLWRSDDGCHNFTYVGAISTSSGDDKEMMGIDNTPSSPHYGRIYVGWTDFNSSGDRNKVIYSDNGGLSWSAKASMPGSGSSGQGMWPAIAPNGDVYFALLGFTGSTRAQWIYKSTDGGDSFVKLPDIANNLTPAADATATSSCGRDALNGDIRNLPSPQIAISEDPGATAGYILHALYPYDSDGAGPDASNVFYRRSLDGGATWQTEIQLNDDTTDTDQFFPALAVAPGGLLGASWYDRRLDASNLLFDRFMTYSPDQGATWSANERVSDVSSPVAETNPNFDGLATCYHGDYDQVAGSADGFHVVWSDDRRVTSTGPNPDVYYDKFIVNLSKGHVTATPTVSSCSGSFQLALADQDLAGSGTATLLVTTDSGDDETLTLDESAPGTFNGSVAISTGPVATGDGVVQGADGTTVTFLYDDADDGTGNPALATATVLLDCTGPVIGDVGTGTILGTAATVNFTTSEASSAEVHYGTSCTELDATVATSTLATSQAVTLVGLTPNTPYFFSVVATDAVGNQTADDNAGNCYSFTTASTILSESFEGGLGAFTVESGLWHLSESCASTQAGHSLPASLYFGQDATCDFSTGARTFGLVRSIPFTLQPSTGASLSFNYFVGGESSTTYDQATVMLSVDDAAPVVIAGTTGTGVALLKNSGVWNAATVDLTPYLGTGQNATVELLFSFDSIDSVANTGVGFLVDDVEVTGEAAPVCGVDADCDDGVSCTSDSCDVGTGACVHAPDNALCDNGLFCDGAETCDVLDGCQPGTAVLCEDGVNCTVDACNETTDSCESAPNDALCDNGLFCDGTETCDALNGCQPGTAVVCDDDVSCTVDACNETTDACESAPNDALCDNGLFCDGAETCDVVDDCVAGQDPCAGSSCDETLDQCVTSCQEITLEAEDMFHSTGGSTTDGWNIWSNGYISANHNFAGGDVELTVVARGSFAGGAWPHMVVLVAGNVVYETDVMTADWTGYAFSTSVATGTQEIRVQFTNDYYQPPDDRNLYVDKVVVGCTTTPDGCSDGELDGDETDVDCGGGTCPACPDGGGCLVDDDCQGGLCQGNVCVAGPTCTDGEQNGDETDIDCGGGTCPACPDGSGCLVDNDCQGGLCQGNVCVAGPTCTDGEQNGDETDVDCGGGTCPACPDGSGCLVDNDCQGGLCQGNVCVAGPTCTDGEQNGDETDVDCGGGTCPACPDGDTCEVNADCQSGNCAAGVCQPPVSGDLTASLPVQTDWGGGYCVGLSVTNGSSQATSSWTVVLNTNQSTIYTSWNANFSSSTGQVTVTPLSWNSVIQPGITDSSVGFCANRTSGSSNLPSVVSATGTF